MQAVNVFSNSPIGVSLLLQAPTHKFFKVLLSIGLIVAAVVGAIVTAPVALPITVVTICGDLTVAGGVLSAMRSESAPQDSFMEGRSHLLEPTIIN